MEDTTPSYEQLYMDHKRVLAEYYQDTVDFNNRIIRHVNERDSYKAALASIAVLVGAKVEEGTTAEEYAKRIKDGITQMVLDASSITR